MTAKQLDTTRYRVARAFRHGTRMITNARQLADLSPEEVAKRVTRGFIEDRKPASDTPAPAAKAKE